jgi:hypothetical protein
MRSVFIMGIFSMLLLLLGPNGALAGETSRSPQETPSSKPLGAANTPASPTPGKVLYSMDFSNYAGQPIDEWLGSKGLTFEEAAKDRDRLALSVRDDALVLEAKEQLRGFIIKDALLLPQASTIRLEWGVIKYPEGASYEQEVRNEAIMVYVFFGEEKVSSGHLLYPDLPYFIGLYLCKDDKINTPYKGSAYHEGGRFVCLGNPPPQTTVISEFDLSRAFQTYFEKTEVPPVSGFAIEMDTSDSGDEGKAAGYVRRIAFME